MHFMITYCIILGVMCAILCGAYAAYGWEALARFVNFISYILQKGYLTCIFQRCIRGGLIIWCSWAAKKIENVAMLVGFLNFNCLVMLSLWKLCIQ